MSSRSRDSTGSKADSDLNGFQPELTDEQWSLIPDLFPDQPVGPKGAAADQLSKEQAKSGS